MLLNFENKKKGEIKKKVNKGYTEGIQPRSYKGMYRNYNMNKEKKRGEKIMKINFKARL